MARKLYYRDSYGRVQRDRAAERGSGSSGLPGKPILKLLLILALIIVIVSFL